MSNSTTLPLPEQGILLDDGHLGNDYFTQLFKDRDLTPPKGKKKKLPSQSQAGRKTS